MPHLSLWTIYDSPKDYPGKFVVRRWVAKNPPAATDDIVVCDSLKEARTLIPIGLLVMPRQRDDDPCIVETWF